MTLAEIRTTVLREIAEREAASRAAFVAARRGEAVNPTSITQALDEICVLKRTLATLPKED